MQAQKDISSYHKPPENQTGPSMLYLSIDKKCNENCTFCVAKGVNCGTIGLMDTNEAKNTIKDFANNNGTEIAFTGGEPTLREDLPEIIEYAENLKNIRSISIITNGTIIGDETYINKIIHADKRKIVTLSISLHSHKEKISEKITRSKGTFYKTLAGINNALKNNLTVSIYQVITSENYKDLPEFAIFLKNNYPQIKMITLAYPFPQGSAVENDWIFVKFSQLRPYLLKTLNYLEREKYEINIAACGQFPLCVISGFEETVIKPPRGEDQNISGVDNKESFHEFEMMSSEWIKNLKNKSQKCSKCILNKYCQGFFDKYIDLFKFNGLKVITKDNFLGNIIRSPLTSDNNFQNIVSKLNQNKMNLIIIDKYLVRDLNKLFKHIKSNNLLTVIINKDTVFNSEAYYKSKYYYSIPKSQM